MSERLATLRECAELARDMGDKVLLESGNGDRGQRRMANRILKSINEKIIKAGGAPVEL